MVIIAWRPLHKARGTTARSLVSRPLASHRTTPWSVCPVERTAVLPCQASIPPGNLPPVFSLTAVGRCCRQDCPPDSRGCEPEEMRAYCVRPPGRASLKAEDSSFTRKKLNFLASRPFFVFGSGSEGGSNIPPTLSAFFEALSASNCRWRGLASDIVQSLECGEPPRPCIAYRLSCTLSETVACREPLHVTIPRPGGTLKAPRVPFP